MVQSLLIIMNKIKRSMEIPEVFRYKNVTAVYKNKGPKNDLNSDRGIFTCTVLQSILMKLIYNQLYDVIDENLTDSNVGARKNMSIRNNCFIVNGCINEAARSKSKCVDIVALDFAQCFDALNVDICMNDIYEVGVRSSELNLLYNSDQRSCIAIKTPAGLTKRQDVLMNIAQGEIFSPLKCCVTVDSISKEHASKQSDNLYTYKGSVDIPALGMVDDQLLIMECGTSSVKTNSFINAQANLKRLQY